MKTLRWGEIVEIKGFNAVKMIYACIVLYIY